MTEVTKFAVGIVNTSKTKLISPPPGTIKDLDLLSVSPFLGDPEMDKISKTLVQLAQECDEWVAVSLRRLGGGLTPTSTEVLKIVSQGYASLFYRGDEPFLEPTQRMAGYYTDT